MGARQVHPSSVEVHGATVLCVCGRVHDQPGLLRVALQRQHSYWIIVHQSGGSVQAVSSTTIFTAGNVLLGENSSSFFAPCTHGRNFYPTILLSYASDYIEPMAIFIACTKHIPLNISVMHG